MKLDNQLLFDFFTEKGIMYLNHANTVSTSITFIIQNGLLSRGAVELKNLYQSSQSSDAKDKAVNVWNDIFLDTIDLHGYFPRQNFYGPILFKINIEFLLHYNYDIWITKDNPVNWNAYMIDNEKYFTCVEELSESWNKYERQRKMVTIRNQMDPILFDFIDQVLIDDPKVKIGELVLFNEAVKGFKTSLGENIQLKNKFKIRECTSCFCRSNYLHKLSPEELKKLFLPHNHEI